MIFFSFYFDFTEVKKQEVQLWDSKNIRNLTTLAFEKHFNFFLKSTLLKRTVVWKQKLVYMLLWFVKFSEYLCSYTLMKTYLKPLFDQYPNRIFHTGVYTRKRSFSSAWVLQIWKTSFCWGKNKQQFWRFIDYLYSIFKYILLMY